MSCLWHSTDLTYKYLHKSLASLNWLATIIDSVHHLLTTNLWACHLYAAASTHTQRRHHHHHPLLSCYPVKAIRLHRCDYSVYCTPANRKQRIRSRKQEAGSNRPSDTSLICQPCETTGQGLVMWFRWVSHAGVSQPSPLSAPATVPHYTARHHRLYLLQQALWFLTRRHPFFAALLSVEMTGRNRWRKKKNHALVQLSPPAPTPPFSFLFITVADD